MQRILFASFVVLAACGGSEPEAPEPAPAEPTEAASSEAPAVDVAVEGEIEKALVKADEADGKADKVVEKCTVCGLGMEGDPAYAVQVDDYEVHMCSESCEMSFREHPEESLEKLNN